MTFVEETGPPVINGVPTSVAAFLQCAPADSFAPATVRSVAEFEGAFGKERSALAVSVRLFFENGGQEAVIARGNCTEGGAFSALDPIGFNLLCLVPSSLENDIDDAWWELAAAYCASRRAMLLVDPPRRIQSSAQAATDLPALVTTHPRNAAVYYPRVQVKDPGRGDVQDVASSGAIAGIYARMDSERGVWRAPAGSQAVVKGIEGLTEKLDDEANGRLNRLGINALRSFPGLGLAVWGARTMDGVEGRASEWKYVPVRRLFLYLEESISRGLSWAVFEPNGVPLWIRVRIAIENFLQTLFREGALQGSTPRDAYWVHTDNTTTTQSDLDNGVFNVEIGFAPVKPAEFVILRIQLLAMRE